MKYGEAVQAEEHSISSLELHIHDQFAMREGMGRSLMPSLLCPIYIVMMLAFIQSYPMSLDPKKSCRWTDPTNRRE